MSCMAGEHVSEEQWLRYCALGVIEMKKANECPIQPINDRIVVQRLEAEGKTPGGVLIPDSAKEKPKRGRVLAVGPGNLVEIGASLIRRTMPVKEGDVVLFAHYAGSEVSVDGEDYLILSEGDVLGIVKE